MFVLRTVTVILVSLVLFASAQGQEQGYPNSMLGFLKPGMRIGILYEQNQSNFHVKILSKAVYKVVVDAKKLSAEELVEKHPLAKEGYEKHMKEFMDLKKQEHDSKAMLAEISSRMVTVTHTVSRLYPMTVLAVGNDYFLAESGLGSQTKVVYPQRVISSVRWLKEVEFTSRRKP